MPDGAVIVRSVKATSGPEPEERDSQLRCHRGEHSLAECGGMRRDLVADDRGHPQRVRAVEHRRVHDPASPHGRKVHRLTGRARAARSSPGRRDGAPPGDSDRAASVPEGRSEPVPPRPRGLLDEAARAQLRQQAERGRLRRVEQTLDLGGAQLAVIGEQLEQVEGTFERSVGRRMRSLPSPRTISLYESNVVSLTETRCRGGLSAPRDQEAVVEDHRCPRHDRRHPVGGAAALLQRSASGTVHPHAGRGRHRRRASPVSARSAGAARPATP